VAQRLKPKSEVVFIKSGVLPLKQGEVEHGKGKLFPTMGK